MESDTIERVLEELAEKSAKAWRGRGSECAACPVAEIAAVSAAVLEFYRETKRGRK